MSSASVGALSISSVGSDDSDDDDEMNDDEGHDDRDDDRRGGGMIGRGGGGGGDSSDESSDDEDDGGDDTFFAPDELEATPPAIPAKRPAGKNRNNDDDGVVEADVGDGGDEDEGGVEDTGAREGGRGVGGDDDDDVGSGSVGDGDGRGGGGGGGVEGGADARRGDIADDAKGDAEATGAHVATAAHSLGRDEEDGRGRGRERDATSSVNDKSGAAIEGQAAVAAKYDDGSVVAEADDADGENGHDDDDNEATAPATVRTGGSGSSRRRCVNQNFERDVVEIEIGRSVRTWQRRWKNRQHGVTDGEGSPTEEGDESSSTLGTPTTVITVQHDVSFAQTMAVDVHGKGDVATLVIDCENDHSSSAVESSSPRRATVHYHVPDVEHTDRGGDDGAGQKEHENGHDEESGRRRVRRYVGRASVVATDGEEGEVGVGEDDGDATMVECVALYDHDRGSYVLEIVEVSVTDLRMEGERREGEGDLVDPAKIARVGGREEKDEGCGDEHVPRVRTLGAGARKGTTRSSSLGNEGHDEKRSDPLRRTEAAERRVRDLRKRKGRTPSTAKTKKAKAKAKAKAKKPPTKKTAAKKKTVSKRKKVETKVAPEREGVGEGKPVSNSVDVADAALSGKEEASECHDAMPPGDGGARDVDADSITPKAASSSVKDGGGSQSPGAASGRKRRRLSSVNPSAEGEGDTAKSTSERRRGRGKDTSKSTTTPRKKIPKSG